MNKTKKTLLITATLIGAALAYYYKQHQLIIVDRFPGLDRKIARKAYNTMFLKMLTNQYSEVGELHEDALDEIFMDEYTNHWK